MKKIVVLILALMMFTPNGFAYAASEMCTSKSFTIRNCKGIAPESADGIEEVTEDTENPVEDEASAPAEEDPEKPDDEAVNEPEELVIPVEEEQGESEDDAPVEEGDEDLEDEQTSLPAESESEQPAETEEESSPDGEIMEHEAETPSVEIVTEPEVEQVLEDAENEPSPPENDAPPIIPAEDDIEPTEDEL